MMTIDKKRLIKILFPVFYSIAVILIVYSVWNEHNAVLQGSDGPLYRNLRQTPSYARHGFDHEDTIAPSLESGQWSAFLTSGRRIKGTLPDLPQRRYFSPWGEKAQEFTIVFLIDIDDRALEYLDDKTNPQGLSAIPGVYFAGVGENWEVYFNGQLIRSEMHIDETGKIKSGRTWMDVNFPIDKSLIVPGTNILSLRIIGDPVYKATGVFYAAAPAYIDDYKIIESRQKNFLLIVFCSIFGFAGFFFLILYFLIKNKKAMFNLFFGLFSFILCMYSLASNSMIHYLIPNTNITIRMEYFSLLMLLPVLGIFIETLGRRRITKVTWGYLVFCSYFAITQLFFCLQYGEEIIEIWNYSSLIYFGYVFFYDVVYFHFFDRAGPVKSGKGWISGVSFINIFFGLTISFICGIFDIIDALFFFHYFSLFNYGIFIIHIGMIFTLSQYFSGMYNQLEKSNVMLEEAVSERTVELEKQTTIALDASRAKSQFLATMSHEIRTPLNAVIGLSEIVLQRGKLPSDSTNDIQQIHKSGSTLLGIINDILDISKIEAGGFNLIPVEYETAAFISDTVNLNRVRIGSKRLDFILEIDADFPRQLTGDELRLKQVLNNILSNAIKYTDEGSVTLAISCEKSSRRENEALVCFEVRDTGIGIHEDDMEKLFYNYSQVDLKSHRKVEGTGLGLAISKNIIEMMDGSITVQSEYGKGSCFTVKFMQGIPGADSIGEETAQQLRDFRYAKPVSDKNFDYSRIPNGRVLVVDDMPVNLQVASGLLEPYGLQVDTASSGNEAIEKIKKEKYDLVFMDHMMPGMDGIETVRQIRQWENDLPIIALTANALAGNMEMFLSKGFNGYISKPINIIYLDELLSKWIQDKQSTQTIRATQDEKPKNEKNEIISISGSFEIQGINIQQGIASTGGTKAGYLQVLSVFCDDVKERLPLLQDFPQADNLPLFTTEIHALKGALGTIGAAPLSSMAAELEAAGIAGNFNFIHDRLNGFTENLTELLKNITDAL